MKIVRPNAAVLAAPTTPTEMLKHIERCGRVCYKSEDRISEDSAERFIGGIIKRGHEAVLEHGDFCFSMQHGVWEWIYWAATQMDLCGQKHYLRFTRPGVIASNQFLVSGNVRAWRNFLKYTYRSRGYLPDFFREFVYRNPVLFPELQEANFLVDHQDFCNKLFPVADFSALTATERLVHQTVTAVLTCDRGVSHEVVRHRPASYCQESTRYCNYSSEGFGGEITVIQPCYLIPDSQEWQYWKEACQTAERRYFEMLNCECSPQEARAVLPNSLKTEVVMTANLQEWLHFFDLRTSAAAHPQMREVAVQLRAHMKEAIAALLEDYEHGKQ